MSAAAVFACTQCARCCRNLVETKAKGLPANAADLASAGLYALPREGGLQAWCWEVARMREAGERRGVELPFAPSLGVVVEAGGQRRFVAVVYELLANACPLVTADDRCGAYEERPVVCRAYPLLLTGRAVTVSSVCPGSVTPTEPLEASYGACAKAVEYAYHLPALVTQRLRFLETAGALRLVRNLPREEVAVLARAPRDLLDVLRKTRADEDFLDAVRNLRLAVEG